MLSRRYYRIKTLQALYAFFQGGEPRVEKAERNLLDSIDKFAELYAIILSFYLEVIEFYRIRMEDAKNKFFPTEDEKNPNPKLLENRVIRILQENRDLQRQFAAYKISWTEEQENVRKVYQRIRKSNDLKEYFESGENSFGEDRDFAGKLFTKYIAKSPELLFICEERYLHWTDDFDFAALSVAKTLKLLSDKFSENAPLLDVFEKDEDETPEEDIKFIKALFRKTILNSEEYEKLIAEKTHNWELERIALTDVLLLKMALTELTSFPYIPIKVTLNEYIEMSKYFSTPKSHQFINGILDKLVEEMKGKNLIKKKGRGLI
jgi:transcription antitermination protein NusB